jgi:endonuclease III
MLDKKTRAKKVFQLMAKKYSDVPKIFLDYGTDAQMLCAIILSAQSTDVQTNKVTSVLFKKYKTVRDFASADRKTFEKEIFSTGFYKNKTKNIIACFKKIESGFGGKVPREMNALISLPGVGRKTANLVLLSFGIIEGIAVDTHVARISFRLGLSNKKDPDKIEKDLMALFDKAFWAYVNRLFISHGRAICTAKNPLCEKCFLNEAKLCPRIGVLLKKN